VPCNFFKLPDGGRAIICTCGKRIKPCSVCGAPSALLCDFPFEGEKSGKACDRPLCRRCATHQAPDTDYCPAHMRMLEMLFADQDREGAELHG
jgi:hypothetical protein